MKGMLDFLEKAGLVRKDEPLEQSAPATPGGGETAQRADMAAATIAAASATGVPLNLEQIYADQGVAASQYPAERLLRLVDGLSAMDAATRLMAIRAMDAADESWSIEDPLTDAAAKVKALATHALKLQSNLQAQERETQSRLDAVAARQKQVVGDIRKQISELEALVSRELSRAAQETATQEARLMAAKDQVSRELNEIGQVDQRLRSLAAQFGGPAALQKE